MARVLVIDNYDSFTYNLVQELGELGADIRVIRNDQADLDGLRAVEPDGVVVSPGPCTPAEAGISREAILLFAGVVPVLGVCLGHQAIADVYGGKVVRAPKVVHGKTDLIHHEGAGVLRGLPRPFEATRYHSLVVERDTLPTTLEVTAETNDGLIMGLRHKELPVEGVQFHPESIMTACGMDLLENFLAELP